MQLNNLTITEYKDIRVLTTQQLAEKYITTEKVISNNFNNNKDRYIEGKHYILLQGDDLREFKSKSLNLGIAQNVNKLYLWTEKGAFLHAKSLNADKAWEVYDHLVDTYFRVKKPLSAMELMELQFRAIKEVDSKVNAVDQDLQAFKKDMPLLGIEESRITSAVRKKGVKCLGGKASNAYQDKSLRQRVYSDIYSQLKREFGIDTYKAIKRSQCDLAVSFINSYRLPLALEEEIRDCNAQLSI